MVLLFETNVEILYIMNWFVIRCSWDKLILYCETKKNCKYRAKIFKNESHVSMSSTYFSVFLLTGIQRVGASLQTSIKWLALLQTRGKSRRQKEWTLLLYLFLLCVSTKVICWVT